MAFPLLGLLGAGFYLATTDSIYTALTQILIEPKIPQLLQQQSSEINLSLDTSQVETQLAVIRSEKIASMVIAELSLVDNRSFKPLSSPSLAERFERVREIAVNALAPNEGPQAQESPNPTATARDLSEKEGVTAQLSEFKRRRHGCTGSAFGRSKGRYCRS